MIIPAFKEVYTKEIDGDIVKTICELISTEGFTSDDASLPEIHSENLFHKGQKLSFGIAKTSSKGKYNKHVGMKLAYAMAIRFLMLKLNNGEKFVEDNIH